MGIVDSWIAEIHSHRLVTVTFSRLTKFQTNSIGQVEEKNRKSYGFFQLIQFLLIQFNENEYSSNKDLICYKRKNQEFQNV